LSDSDSFLANEMESEAEHPGTVHDKRRISAAMYETEINLDSSHVKI
jgi:hypothetical protein